MCWTVLDCLQERIVDHANYQGELCSFDNINVLPVAHVLEYLWPYGCTDLPNVRLFQEKHEGAGLANASTDAEWNLAVYDGLVVWELEEIELAGNLQLLPERLGVNADTH